MKFHLFTQCTEKKVALPKMMTNIDLRIVYTTTEKLEYCEKCPRATVWMCGGA